MNNSGVTNGGDGSAQDNAGHVPDLQLLPQGEVMAQVLAFAQNDL